MKNFNRPYSSSSISEFWSRWHISLSTWFRDYLYIPLGGNKVPVARWVLNILIVFMLSGLWHGANWTFVIWGGLHAIALLYERFTQPLRKKILGASSRKIWKPLSILLTFSFVCFAWIFFRAPRVSVAFDIINRVMHIFNDGTFHHLKSVLFEVYNHKFEFLLVFLLLLTEKLDSRYFIWDNIIQNRFTRYLTYYLLVILVGYSWITHDASKSFIYFQF